MPLLKKLRPLKKKVSEPVGLHKKSGRPKKNSGYAEDNLVKTTKKSIKK